MSEGDGFPSLEFTARFVKSLISGRFSASEINRIVRALTLLDSNERHPSLRVHSLKGEMQGTWSASASDEIRITFERLESGRKRLISATHHYQK
jgi:mRNA-degrading endonuclease YafQ of YafQ-DinJ toxin-antitoxin module